MAKLLLCDMCKGAIRDEKYSFMEIIGDTDDKWFKFIKDHDREINEEPKKEHPKAKEMFRYKTKKELCNCCAKKIIQIIGLYHKESQKQIGELYKSIK